MPPAAPLSFASVAESCGRFVRRPGQLAHGGGAARAAPGRWWQAQGLPRMAAPIGAVIPILSQTGILRHAEGFHVHAASTPARTALSLWQATGAKTPVVFNADINADTASITTENFKLFQ
jgi:hypothetical protein